MRTVLLTLTVALLGLAPAANAELEFEKARHDFGDISHYGAPEVTFVFTNTGDEAVHLKAAKPTARLARTTLPEEPVAAGASAEIRVAIRSRYGGPFRVHIGIEDDTATEVARLVVTGNVLSPARQPEALIGAT